MTQLWRLTDLSTKLVINRQRTPFNKYQHQIDQAFWVFFVQHIVQLLGFSILWSYGWKRELWKLFQKRAMHTILDIHVCIAKFKIQIEKHIVLKNKTCFFKEKLTWFEAQRCCASTFGQLAAIDDTIVSCNNIPSGAETLWTGNVRRQLEWIAFQGKLGEIDRYTYMHLKYICHCVNFTWTQLEKFEDIKVVIRRRRTDTAMAKRKGTKGQTKIYKTYTYT